jgi:two-component system chemotaxis response regulator CheB
MFASVAQACAGTALGVVLTGMGSDGAKGALQLRERGNPVLVQDEASSVVWGMPGSVMTAGAADAVIAIERMPTSILEWMEWTSRGNP